MHPLLKFSGIRRSIRAIACMAAIAISAGRGDSSLPELGNSSPKQTLQTASVEPALQETAADQRARALLAQMTLDERGDIMHGQPNNFYGFYNAPIPRLGIPALTMADGSMGVRIAHPDVNGQRATRLPSGLALAATRDTSLAKQCGKLDRTDPYAGINSGFFLFQGVIAASPYFPEQPRSMNSNSSIRSTGTLTAPVAGSKQLALTSTGTSRLLVDGNEAGTTTPIESVTIPPRTNTVAPNFEAGSIHDVRIEFVNDAPTTTDTGPRFRLNSAVQTAATTPAPAAPAPAATAAPATSAPLATTGRAALEVP